MWLSRISPWKLSLRSRTVCSLGWTPSAFSVARSEAVAWPTAQMPQMREVICEESP